MSEIGGAVVIVVTVIVMSLEDDIRERLGQFGCIRRWFPYLRPAAQDNISQILKI
jgi:hypothetical protein